MSSFLGHRRKSHRLAAAAGGIKTDLVAWWDLEEASGDRLDAHTNGLDLTANGSLALISSAAGQVGDCVSKTGTSGESLYHADDALFDITGDMTIAGWVNFSSAADNFALAGKWLGSGDQRSYLVYKGGGSRAINFITSLDGSTSTYTTITSGSLSLNTWYFIVARLEVGGNSTLYVDNSSVATTAAPASVNSGSARFELFSFNTSTINTRPGKIDSLGIWNRALDRSEITTLWNSGSGVAYADL